MNKTTFSINTLELEWHQLELRYQSLRLHTETTKRRLMLSIDEYGLLTPIMVTPSGVAEPAWVVIDGYLRILACKAMRYDTITARAWDITVPEALLQAYRYNESRPWIAFEEANLIQELITLHAYTQEQLAKKLGKSAAWICRRLQLLHDLPDFVRTAIHKNALSTWSASRILTPLARANSEHAKQFVNYLHTKQHSSRDIQSFYEHYLRSNHKVRKQITANPSLFFKSLALIQLENKAQYNQLAPEYLWESKLAQMGACLQVLQSIHPAVFYPQQEPNQRKDLLKPFNQFLSNIDLLHDTLREQTHA